MPETLQTKSVKQEVMEMIQRLPDDCTLEDIEYQLYVYAGVREAIADIDAGRVVGHDEVERMLDRWLNPSEPMYSWL